VYTAGHTALSGDSLTRPDTAARGLDLARMMARLLPGEPEVAGLLALLVLPQARDAARIDEHGDLVLLPDQDRGRWDRPAVAEGMRLGESALFARPGARRAPVS